jgi:hypothetical protein
MHKRHFSAITVVVCGLTFVALSLAQSAPEMPKIEGESLAGHKVVLPDAAAGRVTVLIFGFSKASKVPTSAWASKLQADFRARPDFALYQLPVLEDVPRFVRKMVISGIKKGVPEGLRDHFVPILQGEAELKKVVHYKEPDEAYLVLLDRAGNLVRQSHGAPNDANYAGLRGQIEALQNQK